jgi:hypothetical protein
MVENLREVAKLIRERYPRARTAVYDFAKVPDLTVRQQVQLMSDTSILLTPCGGLATVLTFLRPHSTGGRVPAYRPHVSCSGGGKLLAAGRKWRHLASSDAFLRPPPPPPSHRVQLLEHPHEPQRPDGGQLLPVRGGGGATRGGIILGACRRGRCCAAQARQAMFL